MLGSSSNTVREIKNTTRTPPSKFRVFTMTKEEAHEGKITHTILEPSEAGTMQDSTLVQNSEGGTDIRKPMATRGDFPFCQGWPRRPILEESAGVGDTTGVVRRGFGHDRPR